MEKVSALKEKNLLQGEHDLFSKERICSKAGKGSALKEKNLLPRGTRSTLKGKNLLQSGKGVYCKRREEFAPLRSFFFLLEQTPFYEGRKKFD